jgi:hypothetical protein
MKDFRHPEVIKISWFFGIKCLVGMKILRRKVALKIFGRSLEVLLLL